MSTVIKRLRKVERHRKVQVAVTTGTILSVAGAHFWPGSDSIVVLISLATNAVWIWAE